MLTRITLLICLLFPTIAGAATYVTKDSITWNFNANYTTGQFVTGDWYVVAPSGLTVSSITKTGTYAIGGSMKNIPATTTRVQGYYDNRSNAYPTYDPSLNVGSSNIALSPGDMLISTTVFPLTATDYTHVQEAAILTVLSAAPAYGSESFRPGLRDATRTIYNAANINYSLLANVTPTSGAPSLTTAATRLSRPWLDHISGHLGRDIHPHYTMEDYGAEMSRELGDAALLLNCNFSNAEKKPLAVGLIQAGLDFYSNVKINRLHYQQDPAHTAGRKLPIMFAGNLLNIAEIKAIWPYTGEYLHTIYGSYPSTSKIFSEDQTIADVKQQDVNLTTTGIAQYLPDYNYTTAMIGMPEWFHHSYNDRAKGNAAWNVDSYRYEPSTWYGAETALNLMGWKTQWNNPVFFRYMDRHVALCRGQADPEGYVVPYISTRANITLTRYSSWSLAMRDVYVDNGVIPASPPSISATGPSGVLPYNTTSSTLTATATDTDGVAGCKASVTAGVAYASMATTMTSTGGGVHTSTLTGLTPGDYTRYIRCIDGTGLANTDDTVVSFSVDEETEDQECDTGHLWLCPADATCTDVGGFIYDDFCHTIELPENVIGGNLLTNPTLIWSGLTLTGWDQPYSGVTEISGGGIKMTAGVSWPPAAIRQQIGAPGDGKTYVVVVDVSAATDQLEIYTLAQGIQYFYGLPQTVMTEFTTGTATANNNYLYIQTHHGVVRYNDILHVGVYEVRARPAGSPAGMGFSGVTMH